MLLCQASPAWATFKQISLYSSSQQCSLKSITEKCQVVFIRGGKGGEGGGRFYFFHPWRQLAHKYWKRILCRRLISSLHLISEAVSITSRKVRVKVVFQASWPYYGISIVVKESSGEKEDPTYVFCFIFLHTTQSKSIFRLLVCKMILKLQTQWTWESNHTAYKEASAPKKVKAQF